MRFGLLGRKLGHSPSPLIHELFGLPDYRLYEVEPEDVEAFVRGGRFAGLNVTIPYKQAVMSLCDEISETARRAGSVNTLLFEGGKIVGHNTDCAGLSYMLHRAGITLVGKRVAILGSGGGSCAASLVAREAGAHSVTIISRSGPVRYEDIDRYDDAQILINTTPVGMYPENAGLPLPLESLPLIEGVADMIYNPLRTRLLMQAQARGIPCANGLAMLVEQGRAASEFFQKRSIPQAESERVIAALYRSIENIVLVGMPGCGKSAVGAEIARLMDRPLLDTDALAQEETGTTPAEMIATAGEAAFRAVELKAILHATRQTGAVIATGGGAVLSEENRIALRQTGRVYRLNRPLELLDTSNRPLSFDLHALYAQRQQLYREAAHCEVDALGGIQTVAQAVAQEFMQSRHDV